MANANGCLFRCLGCKTKVAGGSEFININESLRQENVMHINDLIVSKPQLVADVPKCLYVTKLSSDHRGSSLGSIKEPIAIPIKHRWPSDLSFEDTSTQIAKGDKKVVVSLSEFPGLLNGSRQNNEMTLSRSIALAENIYQNERRQLERLSHENYTHNWKVNGTMMHEQPIFEEVGIGNRRSFSMDESTKSTATRSEEKNTSKLEHICNVDMEYDDADSLTSRMWNMFVNASRAFNGRDTSIALHEKDDHIDNCTEGWINYQGKAENYIVTPREALEIVEGAIRRLNQNNL